MISENNEFPSQSGLDDIEKEQDILSTKTPTIDKNNIGPTKEYKELALNVK